MTLVSSIALQCMAKISTAPSVDLLVDRVNLNANSASGTSWNILGQTDASKIHIKRDLSGDTRWRSNVTSYLARAILLIQLNRPAFCNSAKVHPSYGALCVRNGIDV